MSKVGKNYGWLNSRPNSAKPLLARAKREVPGFAGHIRKFEEQITIKSYSESTVFSYSRSIAQISLYFRKSPLYRESQLLPVPYYHIVFTLPHSFNELLPEYVRGSLHFFIDRPKPDYPGFRMHRNTQPAIARQTDKTVEPIP